MTTENRERLWLDLIEHEADEMIYAVERDTIEPGRTFSFAAMEELHDALIVFVGTRLARRWDRTGEPPTVLHVEIRVTLS